MAEIGSNGVSGADKVESGAAGQKNRKSAAGKWTMMEKGGKERDDEPEVRLKCGLGIEDTKMERRPPERNRKTGEREW